MNISLSEASAYKLWKALTSLCNNTRFIPRRSVCNFFTKYLTTNSQFVKQHGSRTCLSWKVMVKCNLTELIVKLMARQLNCDAIDELHYHRLWQIMHLDNMTVFFEKVIELVDDTAPANSYIVSSQSMFLALCSVAGSGQTMLIDTLHFICYFYCGTSPGFLHRHEAVLLLQDICRDWITIYDRIFSWCELNNQGTVTPQLLRARCPMLLPDDSSQSIIARSDTVTREVFTDLRNTFSTAVFNSCRIDISV